MQNKIKIYLDTSVISALFDEKNPERKILTKNFFEIIEVFNPYVSELTIAEIEKTPYEDLKDSMMEFIAGFEILTITDDLDWLANEYVHSGAIPAGNLDDAYHIA